jgi:hypothetical protein
MHKIVGISNEVFLEGKRGYKKHYVTFLEYDNNSRANVIKDLKKIGELVHFSKAYVLRSRPNRNDRWHVIIPEIFDVGEWLVLLYYSNCDDSYKSMSIKRGYSVLRVSMKKDIGSPKYAFTFTNSKRGKLISGWHAKFLEIQGATIGGKRKKCGGMTVGYVTGHFD